MSSAVARPIRSSSKKLTSSKTGACFLVVMLMIFKSFVMRGGAPPPRRRPRPTRERTPAAGRGSDFLDAARLAAGEVDAQLLRGPEDVLVGLAHLDGHAVAGEHLDVEAEGLHLLDEHLERLGDSRLGDVL